MKLLFNCNVLKPICFILALIAVSCSTGNKSDQLIGSSASIKYAEGFAIRESGNIKYVTVKFPYPDATEGYEYLLVPSDEEVPTHAPSVQVIRTPIKTIVCTSTTHIPLLDYIGETHALVGFPTTDYICSEEMRKRVDAGKITDLGIDAGMNIELLYSLHADMVMGYTLNKDLGQLKKINEMGTPVVINSEYLERHPLGRAEWIKFVAVFFDKSKEADSVFAAIEAEYLRTMRLISNVETRPTTMSGIVYGDAWFMPAGGNYAARLYHDAGMDYLWKDTESTGFLELSFESVYAKAKEAELWVGVGSFNSLSELKASESRYGLFKPFAQHQVYNYNARMGAKGGNEYLELGYLRADLILKDLVKIAHPGLLPDYDLFFYKKLE